MNYKVFVLGVVLFCSGILNAARVGLLVVATGKYDALVAPLIESADQYFCPEHDVTYFVFTDGTIPARDDVVRIEQNRLGWPYDTMMRCKMYAQAADRLIDMDYLFACDADMRFVDTVGDEILSERVATQHPGFIGKRGTYETRIVSTACVQDNEGAYYFAGGFYGGSRTAFLKMARAMHAAIREDLLDGLVAVWHDESHLNRYFIDNPPTKILSPSYCYPESWSLPYAKKLLALDKNHAAMRS